MMRIFMAPGLYVQGPGVLDRAGTYVAPLGASAALVCDAGIRHLVEPPLSRSLSGAGVGLAVIEVSGDVTERAVAALGERLRAGGFEVVLGAGGGRALDLAKGGALEAGLAFVSVPTIASTDAPASRGVPVLAEDLTIQAVRQMPRNPGAVIVDTALIARAPMRFLAAGMGDALSNHFEAMSCRATGARTKHGAGGPLIGQIAARACYDTVLARGREAMEQARSGVPGEAFEDIVETVILTSCVAFENSGLALAHCIAPALAASGERDALHGEHAAYGTLVQGVFEERPQEEMQELIAFCKDIGLPVGLRAFAGPRDLPGFADEIAAQACALPHAANQRPPVSVEKVAAAMMELETLAETAP